MVTNYRCIVTMIANHRSIAMVANYSSGRCRGDGRQNETDNAEREQGSFGLQSSFHGLSRGWRI